MRIAPFLTAALVLSIALPSAAQQGRGAARREHKSERAEHRERGAERREGPHDPGVNRRQKRQASRVCRGVHKGSLTPAETKGLVQQEKTFAALEQDLKGDGELTSAERKQLHGELNDLSHDIFQEKHDDDNGTPRPRVADRMTRKEAAEAARKAHRLTAVRGQLNNDIDEPTRVRLTTEHDSLVDALYDADAP